MERKGAITPTTTRGQRLKMARPNPILYPQLQRLYPKEPADSLAHIASIPGIDLASARQMLTPMSDAELQKKLLPQYDHLQDFDAAAARLADAVMRGEHISVSGDYDCDGNSATALMVRFLHASGVAGQKLHVHIPNREVDGYGINLEAVKEMQASHIGLLLTLDNGTQAHGPLEYAKSVGIDPVVIDHHPSNAKRGLPKGALVVNPRRHDEPLKDDPNGVADLAAVGVTWLICRRATQMLQQKDYYAAQHITPPNPDDWLGLVALATQADVVNIRRPLNRALIARGLEVIRQGRDPYIAALARVAQVSDLAQLNEEDISFKLAPIINAPGRLNQSVAWHYLSPAGATSTRTDTLLSQVGDHNSQMQQHVLHLPPEVAANTDRALKKMAALEEAPPAHDAKQYALMLASREANERRKQIEQDVLKEARPMARAWIEQHPESHTLVLAAQGWHEGVIGIVAGRLKEEFNRPVVVASINPETGMCKASARGIRSSDGSLDIGDAFHHMVNEGLLAKGGGHAMAAGATIAQDKIEAVRARFEALVGPATQNVWKTQHAPLAALVDLSTAEAEMPPLQRLQAFAQQQERYRPFGEGTPKPRVGLHGMAVRNLKPSADGRHLFFDLSPPVFFGAGGTIHAAAFHAAGTDVEAALRRAERPKQEGDITAAPVLSGSLSYDEHGEIGFQLEDMLEVPVPARADSKQRADAVKQAVGANLQGRAKS